MASNRATLRNPYWWIALTGLALQIVGYHIQSRARIAGNILWFVGLGLFFSLLKVLYDNLELKAKTQLLILRDKN